MENFPPNKELCKQKIVLTYLKFGISDFKQQIAVKLFGESLLCV